MGSPFWTVAEFLNNAAIAVCFQLYLHRRLGTKKPVFLRLVLGGLGVLALMSGCQLLQLNDSFRIPLLVVYCIIYGVHVARGTFSQRLFHAFVAFSLAVLSDVTIISLLTFLPGVTFSTILRPTPYRLIAIAASKAVLLILALWNSRQAEGEAGSGPHLIYVAFVPLTSVIVMTVMVQYESAMDTHASLGLMLLTLGLLAINFMLLGLHGRLTVRAAELQEKQRMLEQSEIQNRYFQEMTAANNNMRGFRHDLKNHLQVLDGLLSMNKLERARAYLQEIGEFVDRNDLSVNSGLPLVDAVLGGKIAMAKRLGIDISHTVLLQEELPLEALDLCSLMGNTLDNALEACQKIPAGKERRIELSLTAQNGILNLAVENTVPTGCCTSLKSTKKEDGHGLGLSIVQQTVEKYNGEIQIDCASDLFSVRITLGGVPNRDNPDHAPKPSATLSGESLGI